MNSVNSLIFSYSINFPVLADWKVAAKLPIGLLFENELELEEFESKQEGVIVVDAWDNTVSLERYLTEGDVRGLVLMIPKTNSATKRSVKIYQRINEIFTAAKAYSANGKKLRAACFLGFIGSIPEEFKQEYCNSLFVCRPTSFANSEIDLDLKNYIPDPKDLALVKDKLTENRDLFTTGTMWLYAAAAFLYPWLKDHEEAVYEEILQNCIPQIISLNECYREADDMVYRFIDLLFDLSDQGVFDEVISLGQSAGIPQNVTEDWFEANLFVRGHDLFMSEKYFKGICRDRLEGVPIDIIKSKLRDAGILVAESNGQYTTKMYYSSASKYYPRMIRIRMDNVSNGVDSLYDRI